MSLDVAKLEKVRELAGGIVRARCPACAEGGHDRSGEHLRIYSDGRFGCCVHPKDGEHRKRIWALAGVRKPGVFSLRLKTPPAMPVIQSVKAVLTARTPRTPKTELETSVPVAPTSAVGNSRTARTANVELRARARVDCKAANIDMVGFHVKLEDSESAVRDAREFLPLAAAAPCGEPSIRLPFLTAGGTLSIPFDSPERYHWWKSGQSIAATLAEVRSGLANEERMNHAHDI